MERVKKLERANTPLLGHILRSTLGAIDLSSIMVAVIIVGVIGAVIAASVFTVIPWSQDKAAQVSLRAIQTAETVAMAKEQPTGKYLTTDELVAGGYLSKKVLTVNAAAAPDIRAGRGMSIRAAATPDVSPGEPVVVTNSSGSCYVAAIQSSTGKTWWATNDSTVKEATSTPDTSECAPFPIAVAPSDESGGGTKPEEPAKALPDATNAVVNQWAGRSEDGVSYSLSTKPVCGAGATSGTWYPEYSTDDGATWSRFNGTSYSVTGTGTSLGSGIIALADVDMSKTWTFRANITCKAPGYPDKNTVLRTPGSFDPGASTGPTAPTWAVDDSRTDRITVSMNQTKAPTCPAGLTEDGSITISYYDADDNPLGDDRWYGTLFAFRTDDLGVHGASAKQVLTYSGQCFTNEGTFSKRWMGTPVEVFTHETVVQPPPGEFIDGSYMFIGSDDGKGNWIVPLDASASQDSSSRAPEEYKNLPIATRMFLDGSTSVHASSASITRPDGSTVALSDLVVRINWSSDWRVVQFHFDIYVPIPSLNDPAAEWRNSTLTFTYQGQTNTIAIH